MGCKKFLGPIPRNGLREIPRNFHRNFLRKILRKTVTWVGSEAVWGFSTMPQIKRIHKDNFKQNLQSFSSPNFVKKKCTQMLRIL